MCPFLNHPCQCKLVMLDCDQIPIGNPDKCSRYQMFHPKPKEGHVDKEKSNA